MRRRGWTTLASTVVLVGAVLVLAVSAVFADGFPVRHVSLNDGGIWVTDDQDGLFGRLNKPAGSLDAAFYPPGGAQPSYQLDIVQDGAAVAAWDKGVGKLFPVDVTRGVTLVDQGLPAAGSRKVRLAGGTLAMLDPRTGKVWASRVDTAAGISSLSGLDSSSPPVATVGEAGSDAQATLAVSLTGTVYAVSAAGKLATVRADAGTGLGAAEYSQLGRRLHSVQATAVGDRLIVFDPSTGEVVTPNGATRSLGTTDPGSVLQAAGPVADSVVVATPKSLLSMNLSTGRVTTLADSRHGAPATPVRLDNCVHAAWAGSAGGYVRSCDGQPATPGNLRDAQALLQPEFRVNRGSIVLNDLRTGAVWDLSNQRRVDDWSSVRPPPIDKQSDKSKDNNNQQLARDKPPKAVDDTLGARPGRTTLLHVLDNDSDPAGNILSISGVTTPDKPGTGLSIAPDGQTVAITVPAGLSGDTHFKYTVDDGKGLNATAAVTVEIRGVGENKPPELRPGYTAPSWTVPAGGRLSLPVLADWRDFDGDPVVLVGADAKAGSVTTTTDGFVDYIAPVTPGPQKIGYQVSDGVGSPVPGSVDVTVQSPTATNAVAATTQPDVARGQVGQPITVRPLDNDLPGSDPANPTAKTTLAGEIAAPAGTTVVTDLKAGTVTVTATRAGTFLLDYTAAFGNAPFAKGAIRVDVVAAPTSPAPPVAMPDVAVLHGQLPATVDVLANDFDPSGAVLVVQHAAAVAENPQLQVAIVRGHWLRINALSPSLNPNPQVVRYTVTDGITGPVTGEVTVTQLAAPDDDTPVANDDYVTVRAGDSATVSVLDNDTTPGGSQLSLAANVPGAPGPGQLAITSAVGTDPGAVGRAYVAGNLVRYVAPSAVGTPVSVTVDYVVQNPAGDQAVGHLYVAVTPAPSATNTNRPPTPAPVEARVIAGDTATLSIATTGVDPDGDSVSVTGVASAPSLGRIVSINATSLTYQAYPTSAGTDTFTYQVTDRFGGTGQSTVRIGVVPPGAPQPPVAVDDVVTAAPGARLSVDVLANDLRAPDDAVHIEALAERNSKLASGVSLTGAEGPVQVTAPDLTGKPLVVLYGITDGIGDPSVATITVRSRKDYDVPPIARDAYAAPALHATSVSVDVLAQCGDPDGDPRQLTISRVFEPQAKVDGGKLVLPVTNQPHTVAYEVRDAGGATAVGLVHVPAPGAGGPRAKPGQVIALPRNGTATVAVADYVEDPAGKPVRLTTTDRIWASPAAGLQARSQGDKQLVLTARSAYTGPAALTFQVTDGTSLTDPAAQVAVITVPVQVGPETPVLRCPTDPLDLVEGGATVDVDVSSVCHVWVADPAKLADLTYTAKWESQPAGVTLDGSGRRTLALTAGGSAVPGATGTVVVSASGFDGATAKLPVRVLAAAAPSVAPVTVDGVKAGDTATVDLRPYVRSQLRNPAVSVVSISQTAGMPATAGASGATARITPGAGSHGTITFSVVVTDVADATRADRRATGQITLHVLGVPDAPGTPAVGRTVLSKAVELSWSTPANNGAPIDTYEVSYSGGKQNCPASPCTITGLTNGTTYTFTVRARNVVGWSKPSAASESVRPNTVPGAVTGLAASGPRDGSLQLIWNTPANEGTPVQRYEVTWTGGGHLSVTGTSATPTGLVNDTQYTFTVIAVNAQGPGPAATVQGQSAGAPPRPSAPTFTSVDSANSSTRAVRISWAAVDPNGPAPATYTLTRSGGAGTKTVCTGVTATSCPDDGLANDGTMYSYTVTAANAAAATDRAAHTSPPSPAAQMEATATPDPIANFSARPTGSDGQAQLTFDAPASHGVSNTVTCTWSGGSCGTWSFSTSGQRGVVETINGLPNGQAVTVSLEACNGSHGGTAAGNPCDSPVSAGVTTYGPLRNLTISTSANAANVNFTVSVDPNGRPATVTVQTSRQSQTFTTGVGPWSWSGSDNVGYSSSDTINVTVSDSGRTSLSQSKTQNTGPPPPPPASVTVSKGGPCSAGTTCAKSGTCTSSACAYIHVQTANFPGPVTCTFNSQHGNTGFVTQTFAANDNKDSYNWYGYPGTWVSVTCGGVTGTYTWP